MRRIEMSAPVITDRELGYVADAAANDHGATWDRHLKRFEEAFAAYMGVRHAIATSSGTGALHLGLLTQGFGPGDEIIVPDLTWVATAAVVRYVGATPVFADVERDTWCIDPASVERLLTPRTRAIIPVHMYGHPADMDPLQSLAEPYGITIFEDACPSVGSLYRGRRTGTFGPMAAFSFQGSKILACGEGGALVTDDDSLAARARKLLDHGESLTRKFWIDELGLNYRMSNLQAAMALGQLEHIDDLVTRKRRIFAWYRARLAGAPGFDVPLPRTNVESNHALTSILLRPECPVRRDAFIAALRDRGIDSRPLFPAMSQFPIWGRHLEPQPVAKYVGDHGINLPSGGRLTGADISYVCDAIVDIAGGACPVAGGCDSRQDAQGVPAF